MANGDTDNTQQTQPAPQTPAPAPDGLLGHLASFLGIDPEAVQTAAKAFYTHPIQAAEEVASQIPATTVASAKASAKGLVSDVTDPKKRLDLVTGMVQPGTEFGPVEGELEGGLLDAAKSVADKIHEHFRQTMGDVPENASTLNTKTIKFPQPLGEVQAPITPEHITEHSRLTAKALQKLGYSNQQISNFDIGEIHQIITDKIPATKWTGRFAEPEPAAAPAASAPPAAAAPETPAGEEPAPAPTVAPPGEEPAPAVPGAPAPAAEAAPAPAAEAAPEAAPEAAKGEVPSHITFDQIGGKEVQAPEKPAAGYLSRVRDSLLGPPAWYKKGSDVAQRFHDWMNEPFDNNTEAIVNRPPTGEKFPWENEPAQSAEPFDYEREGATMPERMARNASPEMVKRVQDAPMTDDPQTGYRVLKVPGVGELQYSGWPGDENSRVRASRIEPDLRGQGVGKELYKKAIEDARARGIKTFMSDTMVSNDAQHAWDSLMREGKYPIQKVYTRNFNANGAGGVEYHVDLTPGAEPTTEQMPQPEHEQTLARRGQMPGQTVNLSDAYGETGGYVGGHMAYRVPKAEQTARAIANLGATQGPELQEIPPELLGSMGDAHSTGTHELAHAVRAAQVGLPTEGVEVRSHLHPEASPTSVAETIFDWSKIPGVERNSQGDIWFPKETLEQNWPKFLSAYLAGGVAEELGHGISLHENVGMSSDLEALHTVGETMGFSKAQVQDMIDAEIPKTREALRPVMHHITEAAGTREGGLSRTLLHSAEKVKDLIRKTKEVPYAEAEREHQAVGEQAGGVVPEAQARRAGVSKEGDVREGNGEAVSAPEVEPQTLSDRMAATYPVTDDPMKSRFILSDGRRIGVKDPGETHNQMLDTLYQKYGDIGMNEAERTAFINNEQAVRTRFSHDRAGATIHISVPAQGVTPEQIPVIQRAIAEVGRNGNLVMERADVAPETKNQLTMTKEFPRASDTEDYLKQIQAHPAQVPSRAPKTSAARAPKSASGEEPAIKTAKPDESGYVPVPTDAFFMFASPTEQAAQKEGFKPGEWNLQEAAPNDKLQASAQRYAKAQGMSEINHAPVEQDVARAKAIANLYHEAEHAPNHPAVRAAYDALKAETKQQFHHLRNDLGLKFEPQAQDPYISAQQMMDDIRQNNHLKVFTGSSTGPDHPMSEIDPETGESYNTLFRWVHDAYGHAAGGNDFSENGEKSATEAHAQMYSPKARAAMRAETEGQTSWFFHNPDVESGAKQPGEFAPQKATLVNEDLKPVKPAAQSISEATIAPRLARSAGWHKTAGDLAAKTPAGGIDPRTGKTDTEGTGTEFWTEARQPLDHAPTAADFQSFYRKNKDMFERAPELRVGWDNGSREPGGHELNIGGIGPGAERVARNLDQYAAWDIAKGEPIPTGGSGTKTEFPNYGFERRLADLRGEAPRGSSVPLMKNPLVFAPAGDNGPVVFDLQKALHKALKSEGGISKKGDAQMQQALDAARHEIAYQMQDEGGALGWYDRKTADAIQQMSELHPELLDPKDGPAKQALFKAMWTAMSYGNDPVPNMDQAEMAYDQYAKTGQIPLDRAHLGEMNPLGAPMKWSGYGGNVFTLRKTQWLIDKLGEQGAADFLTTKHTLPEIHKAFEGSGLGINLPKIKGEPVYGARVFGPKGGPFFENLNGIHENTVTDVWGARMLRRWMGTLPEHSTMDADTGLMVDDAPTREEIRQFHHITSALSQELKLDIGDTQALFWYYEHELYKAHGVGETANDYAAAAREVVNKRKGVRPAGDEGSRGETEEGGQTPVSEEVHGSPASGDEGHELGADEGDTSFPFGANESEK